MRLLDWWTALMLVGILVTAVSSAVLAWSGIGLVSGAVVTAEGAVLDSPGTRTLGAFILSAAAGCALAAAYLTWLLWSKYRDWRRWRELRPGPSYWDIAREAEERRKR